MRITFPDCKFTRFTGNRRLVPIQGVHPRSMSIGTRQVREPTWLNNPKSDFAGAHKSLLIRTFDF